MPYIREDQADIRVRLDQVPYGDSWATFSGANLEADASKTRPGGMGREVSVGGPASREDGELTIQMSDVVALWVPRFEARVGNGRINIGITWLGPDRLPTGATFSVNGILAGVAIPDLDSESSDVGFLTVTVSLDEQAA